jgi:hypothetical protein
MVSGIRPVLHWWTPLALACLLIAVAPLAVGRDGSSLDGYTLVVLALLAITLALLAHAERKRLRCDEP